MKSGKGSDTASVGSHETNSSGSYANTTLRSLLCMLPFNLGSAFDSITHDHSDASTDDEII